MTWRFVKGPNGWGKVIGEGGPSSADNVFAEPWFSLALAFVALAGAVVTAIYEAWWLTGTLIVLAVANVVVGLWRG